MWLKSSTKKYSSELDCPVQDHQAMFFRDFWKYFEPYTYNTQNQSGWYTVLSKLWECVVSSANMYWNLPNLNLSITNEMLMNHSKSLWFTLAIIRLRSVIMSSSHFLLECGSSIVRLDFNYRIGQTLHHFIISDTLYYYIMPDILIYCVTKISLYKWRFNCVKSSPKDRFRGPISLFIGAATDAVAQISQFKGHLA